MIFAMLNDLYTKYNIITDGLQRIYVVDIHERRYDLDYTTPIELHFTIPDTIESQIIEDIVFEYYSLNIVFKSRSWVQLLKKLVTFLHRYFPIIEENLYTFRTDWSDAPIFNDHKSIDNMVEIDEYTYFSVNYTAVHSTWIIGDLLRLHGIESGVIYIHRPPRTEPEEIRVAVEQMRKTEFKEFLITKCNKTESQANSIVKSIDTFNKLLRKMGGSYDNLYVCDSTHDLSNCKSRILKDYSKYVSWSQEQVSAARKYLDYLSNYFTGVMKEAKKNKLL